MVSASVNPMRQRSRNLPVIGNLRDMEKAVPVTPPFRSAMRREAEH